MESRTGNPDVSDVSLFENIVMQESCFSLQCHAKLQLTFVWSLEAYKDRHGATQKEGLLPE